MVPYQKKPSLPISPSTNRTLLNPEEINGKNSPWQFTYLRVSIKD